MMMDFTSLSIRETASSGSRTAVPGQSWRAPKAKSPTTRSRNLVVFHCVVFTLRTCSLISPPRTHTDKGETTYPDQFWTVEPAVVDGKFGFVCRNAHDTSVVLAHNEKDGLIAYNGKLFADQLWNFQGAFKLKNAHSGNWIVHSHDKTAMYGGTAYPDGFHFTDQVDQKEGKFKLVNKKTGSWLADSNGTVVHYKGETYPDAFWKVSATKTIGDKTGVFLINCNSGKRLAEIKGELIMYGGIMSQHQLWTFSS